MKVAYHSYHVASLVVYAFLLNSSLVVASLRGNNQHGRVLEEPKGGTFLIAETEYGEDGSASARRLQGNRPQGNRPDRTLNIELDTGIYVIENAHPLWDQGLLSGSTKIEIPAGSTINGATINVHGKKPKPAGGNGNGKGKGLFGRDLKESRTPEQERNLAELNRQLAVVTGTKTVLVVKVNHIGLGNLGTTTDNLFTIANDVFGNQISGGNDAVNLHSQYKACSHNKLNFVPSTNDAGSSNSNDADVTNIVNGIVEVTVNTDCSTTPCDGTMRNDVNNALGRAFGASASNVADHVMHCLPSGAMNGIAYAYINHWNSIYSDRWCQYVSGQVHEIGHNLNLAHASEGSNSYGDQTGFVSRQCLLQSRDMMCILSSCGTLVLIPIFIFYYNIRWVLHTTTTIKRCVSTMPKIGSSAGSLVLTSISELVLTPTLEISRDR